MSRREMLVDKRAMVETEVDVTVDIGPDVDKAVTETIAKERALGRIANFELDTAMLGVNRLRRRKGGNAGVILEMLLELIGSDALTRETRLARREAGEV